MACGATCGITRVRERERQAALDAVERAYAGFVWRAEPARGTRGTHEVDAIVALGRTLEEILPVRALLRQGERGECDSIYLLAGVHTPSLFEVDRDATGRRERGAELHHHETYVRVGISPLGRFVTLQEVTMTASRIDDGSIAIEEDRLVGVEDKRLRHIVKGLQGALRKARWVVLDMAFLIQAPPGGARQDAYEALFGEPPALWSFLFEPAPAATSRIAIVSLASDVGSAVPA